MCMEKPTPQYKLTVVKAFVLAGKVRATHSARLGATALGLELSDMLAVVTALTAADFHKSRPPMPITLYGRTFTAHARRRATCI
jgi:hypothetical protein